MSTVVYTAITQGYDRLQPVLAAESEEVQFVAFLETPQEVRPWKIAAIKHQDADPTRRAKIYKILPRQFFPDAKTTIWLDGKMQLLAPVSSLLPFLQGCDVAVFEHSHRYCLYQEASRCLQGRRDDQEIILRQIQRYTREGFPANQGLYDCAVLLRAHTPKVQAFCQRWWQEIENGSRRDQLSFTYCLWKSNLTVRSLPGFVHNNPWVRIHPHLKARSVPPIKKNLDSREK